MSLAILYSRAASGMAATLVTVEVHLTFGYPGFHIVGLPEAAVKESKDRVRSALMNSKFEFPIRHITVNLAPADLPKEGGRFDLPIAIGILAASGQIPNTLCQYELTGELALSGELRRVRGILPTIFAAKAANRILIIPAENQTEAALAEETEILSADNLLSVCRHISAQQLLPRVTHCSHFSERSTQDLCDVKGQEEAKRMLEIAAAGRHSLLLIGPPGTGKTMLASRLPSILPCLSDKEALEVATVASLTTQGFDLDTWRKVPFRAPHHSSSAAALVGGGRPPRPGEISLAHRGILFLDELPEFSRQVLESLREPLESQQVIISRAAYSSSFPADFQLIATMNPCPCGYAGSAIHECLCAHEVIKRYRQRLSGPLMDRIDMQIEVNAVSPACLIQNHQEPVLNSDILRARVLAAQERQMSRQGFLNSALKEAALLKYCVLQQEEESLMQSIMNKFNFSARVYHRLLRIARTIADLEGSSDIKVPHISQAMQTRILDKSLS